MGVCLHTIICILLDAAHHHQLHDGWPTGPTGPTGVATVDPALRKTGKREKQAETLLRFTFERRIDCSQRENCLLSAPPPGPGRYILAFDSLKPVPYPPPPPRRSTLPDLLALTADIVTKGPTQTTQTGSASFGRGESKRGRSREGARVRENPHHPKKEKEKERR